MKPFSFFHPLFNKTISGLDEMLIVSRRNCIGNNRKSSISSRVAIFDYSKEQVKVVVTNEKTVRPPFNEKVIKKDAF